MPGANPDTRRLMAKMPEGIAKYDHGQMPVTAITYPSGSRINYSYDAQGYLSAISLNPVNPNGVGVSTTSILHDAAGNIVNDGVFSFSFSYSDRGRLAAVQTAGGTVSYLYNGHNLRVAKSGPTAVVPTGAAYYLYDEQGQLLGEYDANGTPLYETIYLGSMLPVGVMKQTGSAATGDIQTTAYNVHADHIATPRVITQQDQTIVWRWDSAEAFGGSVPDQNPSNLGTFTYNQRFPGQVFDSETGLFQNWNREYNARQGRYIQSDPIGLQGGINTFAYVGGNPLSYGDPTGLWWPGMHNSWAYTQAIEAGMSERWARDLGNLTGAVDSATGSQDPSNSNWHAMRDPSWTVEQARQNFNDYVARNLKACTSEGLARALHAIQDSFSPAHRGFQAWDGLPPLASSLGELIVNWSEMAIHGIRDAPTPWNFPEMMRAKKATYATIKKWLQTCGCQY